MKRFDLTGYVDLADLDYEGEGLTYGQVAEREMPNAPPFIKRMVHTDGDDLHVIVYVQDEHEAAWRQYTNWLISQFDNDPVTDANNEDMANEPDNSDEEF